MFILEMLLKYFGDVSSAIHDNMTKIFYCNWWWWLFAVDSDGIKEVFL